MYQLLCICLSLAGLLIITCLASLLAAIFWRGGSTALASWSTSARSQILFLLRVAPGITAILCVGALFVPAYLANEPRHTTEIVTVKLGVLAALSLYGIGFMAWRGFAAWLATRRLVRDWLRHAESVPIPDVPIRSYRFHHPFPVIAIVGAFRPRLFIADQIFHTLSREEISAAVSHEIAHLAAGDNIKKWLLHACRDYLTIIPLGRSLDRAWAEAAEAAADEHAARGGASVALDLASALVKVARIAPNGARPAMLSGTFLITPDPGSIRSRVLRLTELASEADAVKSPEAHFLGRATSLCLAALLATIILAISWSGFLAAIHAALECVVSVLQ